MLRRWRWYSDPVTAGRYSTLASEHQKTADQDEFRKTLASPPVTPGLQSGGSGVASAQPSGASGYGPQDSLDHYLKTIAPDTVQTLLKQGNVEMAKKYSDFMDSQNGQAYAKTYMQGLHAYHAGDNEGALTAFQSLYNSQGFPDGHSVQFKSLGDGKMQIDQIGADGNVRGSKTGNVSDLTKQAALALNPVQAVKFMAEQQGKRDTEGALLDRQVQLENLRQSGQENREDRRDERLNTRLDAQSENLDRRLSAGGRTTMSQDRGNMEIDAAREAITGMSPQEIMRRTAKATNTGRANPDYSPGLARQAELANRRKIGADDWFDTMKKLAEALKILIALEREAYGIDARRSVGESIEELLERLDSLAGVPA